jgi:hypothetical protein
MTPSYMKELSDRSVVFSTNKTNRHDIIKILLKVALKIINQTKTNQYDNGLATIIRHCVVMLKFPFQATPVRFY